MSLDTIALTLAFMAFVVDASLYFWKKFKKGEKNA